MKGDLQGRGFSTRAIHAGQHPDPTTGAVTVPIYATSTYVHDAFGVHKGYEYARVQNRTREALEANLASLEGGRWGHVYASGMAAISSLLSLLRSGEHGVFSEDVYGGTYRLVTQVLERQGLEASWVDTSDLGAVAAAIRPNTRLLYVETPTNPLLGITDLRGAAELARKHQLLFAVDNTFLSPYLQRPLELGVDVVIHSTTKYLNGHSDSLGGALITNRQDLAEWFAFTQKAVGAILSPFEAFLVLRGTKTLAVRMERHETNGRAVARFLASRSEVERLYYPGLPDHPGREIHERQARGYGSMMALELGSLERARRFLEALEVFSLAESLGGVESLACHPATMTHASVPPERRQKLGITDGLVRLSVGIEDESDLLADLERALAAAS